MGSPGSETFLSTLPGALTLAGIGIAVAIGLGSATTRHTGLCRMPRE